MVELARKALKAANLLREPVWRKALQRGVAASIEHDRLPMRTDFGCVIDVGANRGQFALYASVRFPKAQIYSLEPLSKPRSRLQKLFAGDPRFHVIAAAAGCERGRVKLNVSHQDDSSSVLATSDLQLERYPQTGMVGAEEVELETLDALFEDRDLTGPVLLKLDVQGYELEALKGAGRLLQRVDQVVTEASFVPFYEGQVLFDELNGWLNDAGFTLVAGALSSQAHGRWEQGDFLYERRETTRTVMSNPATSAA